MENSFRRLTVGLYVSTNLWKCCRLMSTAIECAIFRVKPP